MIRPKKRLNWALVILPGWIAAGVACSPKERHDGGLNGHGSAGGQGGAMVTTSSGMGGNGGTNGEPQSGRSGTEIVSAGELGVSTNYRMVFTLGQPTQNQGKTMSSNYRLQGGIVGTNGSLP